MFKYKVLLAQFFDLLHHLRQLHLVKIALGLRYEKLVVFPLLRRLAPIHWHVVFEVQLPRRLLVAVGSEGCRRLGLHLKTRLHWWASGECGRLADVTCNVRYFLEANEVARWGFRTCLSVHFLDVADLTLNVT